MKGQYLKSLLLILSGAAISAIVCGVVIVNLFYLSSHQSELSLSLAVSEATTKGKDLKEVRYAVEHLYLPSIACNAFNTSQNPMIFADSLEYNLTQAFSVLGVGLSEQERLEYCHRLGHIYSK
jgi:hypothetical protein